jgi:hypothetical protein
MKLLKLKNDTMVRPDRIRNTLRRSSGSTHILQVLGAQEAPEVVVILEGTHHSL